MAGDPDSVNESMLLLFRAENVRSFRDKFELSMLATAIAQPGVVHDIRWREGGRPIRVLPAAGVFGANASGKSNLLRALADMRSHVMLSFRSGDLAGGILRRPFRLDPVVAQQPSCFEIDLVLHGVRWEYGFRIDDQRVLEEWAYRYPHGKAALLFRRTAGDAELTLGGSHRAQGRAVERILRPNALFLSAAAAGGHPDLTPLHQWFADNLWLAEASSRPYRWAYTTHLLHQPQTRRQVLALLHAADLGITDARVRELDPQVLDRVRRAVRILQGREDEPEGSDFEAQMAEIGLVLSHRGAREDVEFDAADESLGTLVWLGLAGPIADALSLGNVVLVDEIEASLHPALVAQLVRLFQSPDTNPRGAQLIFNSHEATLLGDSVGDRILGRDQVWFTEKAPDGATRLYPLADLDPRNDEAVGRRYLAGRYGAIPIVVKEEFAEVASMIVRGDPG
jgi:uncharacterized protein